MMGLDSHLSREMVWDLSEEYMDWIEGMLEDEDDSVEYDVTMKANPFEEFLARRCEELGVAYTAGDRGI